MDWIDCENLEVPLYFVSASHWIAFYRTFHLPFLAALCLVLYTFKSMSSVSEEHNLSWITT